MTIDHNDMRACAAGGHCATRTNHGPAQTPRPFCEADRDRIHTALLELPDYHAELHQALGDHSTGTGGRVSGTRAPAAPIRLDLADLAHELCEALLGWEERVRAIARLADAPTQGVRPTVAVKRAASTLTAYLDALLALPPEPMTRPAANDDTWEYLDLDGADAGLELLALTRRCRAALGLTRAPQLLSAPCSNPSCGLALLTRIDGADGLDDAATCTGCGTYYPPAAYTALAAHAIHEATT